MAQSIELLTELMQDVKIGDDIFSWERFIL